MSNTEVYAISDRIINFGKKANSELNECNKNGLMYTEPGFKGYVTPFL